MENSSPDMLSGKRLRLRAPEPADISLLYEWENDTSVWRVSNTFTPFSRFQIEEYVMNARQDIFAARQLRLMIELQNSGHDNTVIGSIDLFDFDPFHLRAGIGILIREQYRNKGFAKEALEILVKYSFSFLQMHQLYCNIAAGNVSSCALFENAGFVRCGVKREWINEGTTWHDELMFQLIRRDE
jgi:diamine N-acetyltransferase